MRLPVLFQQRHATTLSNSRSSRFFARAPSMRQTRACAHDLNPLAPLPFCRGQNSEGRKYRRNVMRKASLITAILLLSAVWAVAQTSPSSPQSTTPGTSSQQPTSPSTSPSQQPSAPDTTSTQTTTTQTKETSTESGTGIEGCLSGSAGNFTLTDQSGKTWQLAGDTSKLSDHVGHQVRLTGTDTSASAAGGPSSGATATGAGAAAATQSTFNVTKVKMISSSCPTSK